MASKFCLPPVRIQSVHRAWPFLQLSVHMNSVHTQMITPRINMPNTMIMPIEIEVNKRLSPIKYPWSTIFKNDVTLFSINRWFTFEDIDETDTWLQSVWLNRKSFVNIISIVALKEKKYIIRLIMERDNFISNVWMYSPIIKAIVKKLYNVWKVRDISSVLYRVI